MVCAGNDAGGIVSAAHAELRWRICASPTTEAEICAACLSILACHREHFCGGAGVGRRVDLSCEREAGRSKR